MADYRRAFDISGSPVKAIDGGDLEEAGAFTLRSLSVGILI